jgi:hypothetical protein
MVLCLLTLSDNLGNRPQLDLPGLGLVATALFCLTWAPVRAPEIGWGDREVIGALIAGAILMGVFLGWQRRARYPMIPLRYFRSRSFSTAPCSSLSRPRCCGAIVAPDPRTSMTWPCWSAARYRYVQPPARFTQVSSMTTDRLWPAAPGGPRR